MDKPHKLAVCADLNCLLLTAHCLLLTILTALDVHASVSESLLVK